MPDNLFACPFSMRAYYSPFLPKGVWLYATLIACLLSRTACCQFREQVDVYYDHIKPLLRLHQPIQTLTAKLDSLTTTLRFSRSEVSPLFDRDIDFGMLHRRTIIHTNIIIFQLDAVSENGRIIALTAALANVSGDSIRRKDILLQSCDTSAILQFLASRNLFYQSNKSLSDFFTEIQANEQFAFYCGDASPKTKKGVYIENLAQHNQISTLADMLASIHCETQAYAVAGFDMVKSKCRITPQQRLLVKFIKHRDSVVVTCEGCLSGLRRKLYSMDH